MAKSGVIYAGTGRRKTAQVKWFAHYIAKVTGKATLLLSCDGGGWEPCDPEVRAGMIKPYRVETATIPLAILRNISRGYWPVDPLETNPTKINLVAIDWNEIGGMAVEGWTSVSQVVMRFLPDSGISVGGEDRNKLGGFTQSMLVDGRVVAADMRSNTRGDYGFVQNFIYGLVMNFNSLPCHYVLYTALESKTEDDDRSVVFGPAISGKKATAQCGSWVGDMIHGQDYVEERTTNVPNPHKPGETIPSTTLEMSVRFYYKAHIDPGTGIPFPAKPRVTPERLRDLEKRFPGGYFEPQLDGADSFGAYLETLDRLSAQQADALKDWRSKRDQTLGRVPATTAK